MTLPLGTVDIDNLQQLSADFFQLKVKIHDNSSSVPSLAAHGRKYNSYSNVVQPQVVSPMDSGTKAVGLNVDFKLERLWLMHECQNRFPADPNSRSAKSNNGLPIVLRNRKILRSDMMSYPVNMTCDTLIIPQQGLSIVGRCHQMEYQSTCL